MPGTVGWAGCPLPLQAPMEPWTGPSQGSCRMGSGLTPCRCCREGACPGASAPHGFAEELNKCVQVRVRPNNVSVTSPGVQVSGAVVEGVCQCMHVWGDASC